MGESYSRTLAETAAAMLLIPQPAGVLANNSLKGLASRGECKPS